MEILSSYNKEANILTIYIKGRFDFNAQENFKEAYTNITEKPKKYIVDLNGAEYLDSSALGMLLELREYAGGEEANICLTNCINDVKKILKITRLDQIFKVE